MRIALIDPSLFTWPYDKELATGLHRNGHEVMIYGKYLAEDDPGKHIPYYREIFYPGFERAPLKSLSGVAFIALKGMMHPVSLLKLLRELRRFRPDIIHFQWAPLPLLDRMFIPAFRRIAPVVFTVHDSVPFNSDPRSRLQRLGSINIMRCFDRLIVHTSQARKRLISYGVPERSIARIDHGVLGDETSSADIASPKARSDGSIRLLLFGKLKPYKGADILIRAIAALPSSVKERCRVHIVGKPYMDIIPLRELALSLGVEKNIIWDLRFIDESKMPEILSQADIMVMPYREIDASGVLMMALSMGRPIIASRIGLFAEMLEDGKHGYLVKPEAPEELSNAIAKLIEDEALRFRFGNEVTKLRESIPDWEAIAKTTETIPYQQAIEARAQGL